MAAAVVLANRNESYNVATIAVISGVEYENKPTAHNLRMFHKQSYLQWGVLKICA